MKARKIAELNSQYSFEAPFVNTKDNKPQINKKSYLDLNLHLAPNPDDIYLVRVNGESMIDEKIYHGDVLIVNKKEKPKDGKVVIAAINGEMAVKTFRVLNGIVYLYSANKNFLPIEIKPYWSFEIQGVVKYVIHDM